MNPIGICWSLAVRYCFSFGILLFPPLSLVPNRPPNVLCSLPSYCRGSDRDATIVAGVRDSDIEILDPYSLEVLSSMSDEHQPWACKAEHHKHWVRSVLALPDGHIVSGSDDWTVKVWIYKGYAKPTLTLFGLPPGPISEVDIEIMMYELSLLGQDQSQTPQRLQEQKIKAQEKFESSLAAASVDQKEVLLQQEKKFEEQWIKARQARIQRLTAQGIVLGPNGKPVAMPSAGAPRQGEPAALEPSSEKPPNGDDSLKLNASSPVSNSKSLAGKPDAKLSAVKKVRALDYWVFMPLNVAF